MRRMPSGGTNSWRGSRPPASHCSRGSATRMATAIWSKASPWASNRCLSVSGRAWRYSRIPRERPRSATVG
eukprot:2862270-Alexandrium_andersonii.AAC.1